jgi:hypothetical protein
MDAEVQLDAPIPCKGLRTSHGRRRDGRQAGWLHHKRELPRLRLLHQQHVIKDALHRSRCVAHKRQRVCRARRQACGLLQQLLYSQVQRVEGHAQLVEAPADGFSPCVSECLSSF